MTENYNYTERASITDIDWSAREYLAATPAERKEICKKYDEGEAIVYGLIVVGIIIALMVG